MPFKHGTPTRGRKKNQMPGVVCLRLDLSIQKLFSNLKRSLLLKFS